MAKPESAVATDEWTCERCEMTVSFTAAVERPRLPSTWAKADGLLYCLNCQREMAGEAGVEGLAEDAPHQERQQRRTRARIEFEIGRDPEREDSRIAKSCHTSTMAVRKARARMDVADETPA